MDTGTSSPRLERRERVNLPINALLTRSCEAELQRTPERRVSLQEKIPAPEIIEVARWRPVISGLAGSARSKARRFVASRIGRDLALVVTVATAAMVLAVALDLNDLLVAWTTQNPEIDDLGINELPMVFMIAAFAIAWFARRRWCEYRQEAEAHQETASRLVRALDEAVAASQSKTQFLAIMSHELRTPLNAILGFSEIIENQSLGPRATAKYQEYARDIHASGTHLLAIISDILDIAQSDAGTLRFHPAAIDVGDLLQGVARMISGRARDGKLLVRVETEEAIVVWADRDRLRQAVLNLAINAVKFTQPGGRVTLRASTAEETVAIEIADTGIGIAEHDMARVMTPFQQVENGLQRRYEGTGLGLPLAKRYVERQGGTLAIESRVGEGTTVTIRMPIGTIDSQAEPLRLAHA